MARSEALLEWPLVEEELAEATAAHRECFFALFPVGEEALYEHGRSTHRVRIVEHHGWLERVRVQNVLTSRTYWLDGHRLVIPLAAPAAGGKETT